MINVIIRKNILWGDVGRSQRPRLQNYNFLFKYQHFSLRILHYFTPHYPLCHCQRTKKRPIFDGRNQKWSVFRKNKWGNEGKIIKSGKKIKGFVTLCIVNTL